MQRECPSKRAYIATEDGGYVSASDVEEDDDVDVAVDNNGDDEIAFGGEDTATYRSVIVQRVLSTQLDQADKQQHHNLFQTFFIIKEWRAVSLLMEEVATTW